MRKAFDFRITPPRTTSEIDLVLSRGRHHYLVEIKSNHRIDWVEVRKMENTASIFPNLKRAFYLSNDPSRQKSSRVECLHWRQFISHFRELT
jgi:Holliday junction resolvase-like predicted endonuclease